MANNNGEYLLKPFFFVTFTFKSYTKETFL
jgi:hypothetical protein